MPRTPIYLAALYLLLPSISFAEEPPAFARYPDPVAEYLQQLHQRVQAPFAFRESFPGGFDAWKTAARSRLEQLLGLDTIRRHVGSTTPKVSLGEPIQEEGYQRMLGSIETEPHVTIPFWLLVPDDIEQKRPLVVCAHGHDADGWNSYAGVFQDDKHREKIVDRHGDVGVQAVRRGYIALVPATRGLAAVTAIPDLKKRHGDRPCRAQVMHCLLAGRTAIGERVWDTQRLLDWALESLPQVDDSRVAMLGNSGGGVLTVYMAALDDRLKVSVPSCSFSSYTSASGFIFHCDCCVVPRAQSELGDFPDIGGLAAPRGLLAVHGRKDGLHSAPDVEAAMARVKSIFKHAGAADQFEFTWGDEGHKFYPEIMWPFIERKLAE